MSKTLAPRAAVLAALLLLLASCLLLGLSSRAGAEEPAVEITEAPALNWGFKETWRNYAQKPEVSGGAAVVPASGNAAYDLEWAFETGSFDPATQTTRVSYRGSAHWQKYRASDLGRPKPPGYSGPEADPYLLDVTLSDPQITIARDSSVLTVVATSRNQDTWELVSYGRVPIVNLDVFGVMPTVAGGTTKWDGITATVTSEGSPAMANNYRVGQVVDTVGFSYTGPGGAPDFSEHWDQPGAAVLNLVQNSLFVEGEDVVDLQPFWVDRKNLIVHSARSLPGSLVRIEAFDLKQMQAVGDPLTLPTSEAPAWATNVTAYDTSADRLLFRASGESGMPRWLKFNRASEQYETGLLADPQMSETTFIGANSQRLVWDPIRNRGYRVQRIVPPAVPTNEYDNHEWTLFAYAEGEDGIWSKQSFKLPSFPAGQNQTGFPTTSLNPANYAVASDGSLIALASTRSGLAASEKIPGAFRIVFNEADDGVSVQPLPGVEVLNTILAGGTFSTVQTGANGHILLVRMAAGGEVVHCKLDGEGGVGCDDPVSIRDNVEAGPYDERRYALDSDGTVWFGGVTSQQLAAVRDGAFAGGQFFQQRHPRGGPVLVGEDDFVYAQTNDGSPGESGGSKTWGYGKFERVGFVPTVTGQPQPDTVALSSGEASEEATFSSTATGDPAPARRWQVKAPGSSKFVDVPGAEGETLSVAATRGDDGSEYRAVYANAAGKVVSESAVLSVDYAPLVLQSPAQVKVLEGGDAEFAVLADGKPEPTVTWQRRVGGFWENVTDEDESIVIDGNSLTVVGTDSDQTGAMFRARLANPLGSATSEAAKLTVTPKVTIPEGGIDLDKVTLEWAGSEELQKAPPFGGSNYFSAGVSDGEEASFHGHEGNAFAFQVTAAGAEAIATWPTRQDHVGNGGSQLVRLYAGSGRVEGDGSAAIEWDGAFSVNFYGGLAPFTISDPLLSVDAGGEGELSADMVGCASSMANPSECSPLPPAADVTVATFSGVEVDPAGVLEVTPDYAGVEVTVPSGTTPQDRSEAGWGAWPQPFVDFHVETGLSSYWYSSGGSADPLKAPLPLTVDFAGADAPVVEERPPGVGGGGGPDQKTPPVPLPPSIGPAKGVQTLGGKRRAKVATLSCPGASPCTVKAPRNAPIRIGGRTYWARVFAPPQIAAGGNAMVRARLRPAALAALGKGRATLRVRLQVRSGEGVAKLLARVAIRRSAGAGR